MKGRAYSGERARGDGWAISSNSGGRARAAGTAKLEASKKSAMNRVVGLIRSQICLNLAAEP